MGKLQKKKILFAPAEAELEAAVKHKAPVGQKHPASEASAHPSKTHGE